MTCSLFVGELAGSGSGCLTGTACGNTVKHLPAQWHESPKLPTKHRTKRASPDPYSTSFHIYIYICIARIARKSLWGVQWSTRIFEIAIPWSIWNTHEEALGCCDECSLAAHQGSSPHPLKPLLPRKRLVKPFCWWGRQKGVVRIQLPCPLQISNLPIKVQTSSP